MPAYSDLVHQTTVGTGTGNLTLVAVNGKRSFDTAFGTGGTNVFDYYISNRGAAEWERGTGHLSDATTLVRDTVLASSNASALVDFSTAAQKDITNDQPAAKCVDLTGATFTGDVKISKATPYLTVITSVDAQSRGVQGRSLSDTSAATRWLLQLGNSLPETGSDVGADFDIYACTDAGSPTLAFRITRSTRKVTISVDAAVSGTTASTSAGTGALTVAGGVGIAGATFVTGKIYTAAEVSADGDSGGIASCNTLTGTSDLTANSTGVGSIKFKGTTSRDSSGFIKIYIGTTAYYVPVFSAITG